MAIDVATGMNLTLSDEHEMIRQAARKFAQERIAPIAAEFDEFGEFPMETVREMGQMGFMGIEVPEEYGGAGMDTIAYVLAVEEISKADASHGVIMSVNNSLFCNAILMFGTEEQKQKYMAPVARGRRLARTRLPSRCPAPTRARCARGRCSARTALTMSSMG